MLYPKDRYWPDFRPIRWTLVGHTLLKTRAELYNATQYVKEEGTPEQYIKWILCIEAAEIAAMN